MNCKEIRKYFSAYIDGDISDEIADRIGEHVKKCEACMHELERLKDVVSGLRSMEELEAPPDLLVKVREKIDKQSVLRRFGTFLFVPWRVKIPVEAVSLGLILFLFAYVFQFMPAEMGAPLPRQEAPTVELMEEEAQGEGGDYGVRLRSLGYIEDKEDSDAVVLGTEVKEVAPPAAESFKAEAPPARERRTEADRDPYQPTRGVVLSRKKIKPFVKVTLAYKNREEALKAIRKLAHGHGGMVVASVSDGISDIDEAVVEVALYSGAYPAFARDIEKMKGASISEEDLPGVWHRTLIKARKQAVVAQPRTDDTVYVVKEEALADAAGPEYPVRVMIRLVPE